MADDFKKRLKIYYDAEFTGLHRNTTLISIGMVSASGAYFYAEFDDYDRGQVSDWLQENIIDNLMFKQEGTVNQTKKFQTGDTLNMASQYVKSHNNVMCKGPTEFVKGLLMEWLLNESNAAGAKIQFYTDCYAYDWVLLNHLICPNGQAMQIPEFIDYIPVDLSTALLLKGVDPDITREEYADSQSQELLKNTYPFNKMGEHLKHNCLWDAAICNLCFHRAEGNETPTVKC